VQTYLTVSVRREGESTVVELGGELDLGSSPQLSQALEHASRDEPELVVIDLRELQFIDVAGLRVLLEAQQAAQLRGGRFMLAHVRQPVRRVLSLAQMGDVFTISNNHH
jgi:anti-sigma B factor antagonist